MSDATRWKSTIHIGNLPPQTTLQTLQEAFLPFGEISEISLPKNNDKSAAAGDSQSPHKGYAYVEFEEAEDAKEAIDNMDQSELFGRTIKVSAAKIPKSALGNNQGLGSKTAVWEQEGWLAENAVSEEDRIASEQTLNNAVLDPMQGLEGLDVAGPKPE
ncbi:putative cyclophilin [Podospora fimiseda]|uniref:Cyclophilin n=1 Tax=Podospora fimiseda TaxID=252190 RepID=A0AAN7BRR6_9PEZI|nr:putative cyclophilin [Podospora fimiseda]